MNILWLFNTCGLIVGPAMWAAGLLALGACAWASRRPSSREGRRLAIGAALTPLTVGLGGALFGLVYWYAAGLPTDPWLALGKVCLAGLIVSAVPLAWSLLLPRPGRSPV